MYANSAGFTPDADGYAMTMDMKMDAMQQQMQQLQEMNFPASKQDLIDWGKQHGASSDQMDMIKKLPKDNFKSADDVISSAQTMMKG